MSAPIYRATLEKYYRRTYGDQLPTRIGSVALVAGLTAYLDVWPLFVAVLWAAGYIAGEFAIIGWWKRFQAAEHQDDAITIVRLRNELIFISGLVSSYSAIPCFLTPLHGQTAEIVGVVISAGILLIVAAQHGLHKHMSLATGFAGAIALVWNLFSLGHEATAWIYALLGICFVINAKLLQAANAVSFQEMVGHQVEAERALERSRESEALYRLLADNQDDVISLWDPQGRRVYTSPSAKRAYGLSSEELLGTPTHKLIHPEDIEPLGKALAALTPQSDPVRIEARGFHKDGSLLWVESTFTKLSDGGLLSSARVINERKRLQQELLDALDEARSALAVKSDFLANMTHELRTPLNAIIGFSCVLKDAPDLDPRHARQVSIIWEGSQGLLAVVNDVLDFSRLEAGAVEFDVHPFDPLDMVRSTVALLADQARAKGLEISVASLGDGHLLGDEARLRQVLMNLLSNAVKFTAQGHIEVQVEQTNSAGLRHLRIAVADQGIGIAPHHVGTIFDRFTQADASVSRRYGGTGLGLAISKRIIEGLGGRIGAQSELGQGSTFWFEIDLPYATADANHEVEVTRELGDTPLKILVVDDNPINRELVGVLLEPFDIQLSTANDGVEAVEAATNGQFDIILMDVQMPVMDGLAATRHIRAAAQPGVACVPIIAMTANVLPEQIQRCLDAGMDAHIGKPISPDKLLETLAYWSDNPRNDVRDASEFGIGG